MPPADLREVVEQPRFRDEKKKLKPSAKRLDEVLDGVIWTLARSPESYANIPGTKLYLAKTESADGVTGLFIWFTFNDNQVFLESIEPAPVAE
jgi:hypothetical protein